MSLKLDKHVLLVLAVLLMLVLIPTAFAEDANDASAVGVNNASAVDSVQQVAVGDVSSDVQQVASDESELQSAADENGTTSDGSDVLGSGEDYITNPSPTTVTDYHIGDSKNIVVTPTIDDWCKGEIEDYLDDVYVYIDDDFDGKIAIPGVSTTSAFNFNLNTLTADQLSVGTHTLKFGVNYESLENWGYTTALNPLTVTVAGSSGGDTSTAIYVDAKNGDDSADGSISSPLKTIQTAITKADSGMEIIINNGLYTFTGSSSYSISKNLKLKANGTNVVIQGSGSSAIFGPSYANDVEFIGLTFVNGGGTVGVISGSSSSGDWGSLKIINCTFANTTATYNMIKTYIPTEITGCTFVNNTITNYYNSNGWRGFICFYAASGNVNYNIFMNNTFVKDGSLYVESTASTIVNINNNFWGTNEGLPSSKYSSTVTCTDFLVMEASISTADVSVGDDVLVNVKFKSNSGAALSGSVYSGKISFEADCGSVDETTLENNEISSIYTAESKGAENLIVKIAGVKVAEFAFDVEETPENTIIVDADKGNDETADGTSKHPFATIKAALDNLGNNNTILIKAGLYTLNNYEINRDVALVGVGNVVIITAGARHMTIGNNVVNLTNLVFSGASETSIVSGGDLNINQAVFDGNEGTNVIKTTGNVNIAYTIFTDNEITGNIIDAAGGSAEYNFWGSNAVITNAGIAYTNWAVIDANIPDMDNNTLTAETEHTINVVFKANDDSQLEGTMPYFDIAVTAENGLVDSTARISENVGVVNYICNDEGEDHIYITIDTLILQSFDVTITERENGRIYVDQSNPNAGNGTKKNPYKSLSDAVAANNAGDGGNEIIVYNGTYVGRYTFTKDVTITARGNVILDVDGYHLSSYTGSQYHSLTLNNVVVINQGNQFVFQYLSNLVLNNCIVENNTGGNGIIDSGVGNVQIVNSTFRNLKYSSSYAPISTTSPTEITNSVFNNITYSYSYFISGRNANINGNFWGVNDVSGITSSSYASAISNWIVAIPTWDVASISKGESAVVTVKFFSTTDGEIYSELTDTVLPETTLVLTANTGSINPVTVTLTNNIGSATYNALVVGEDQINVTSAGKVIATLDVFVEEPDDPSVIFVDASASAGGNGSKAAPFNNLKDAFDALSDVKNTVAVLEGTYTISDYTINKDAYIRYSQKPVTITATNLTVDANVVFDHLSFANGDLITLTQNNSLTVVNSTFINNAGVISSKGNLIIKESKFINNTAGEKGVIAILAGSVDIKYSEFIASTGLIVYSDVAGDINDNYFGSADAPNVSDIIKPASWVALVIGMEGDSINASEVQKVFIDFKNTTDGTTFGDLSVAMPSLDVEIIPTIGSIDKVDVTVEDNAASATYSATTEGNETIKFSTYGVDFDDLEFVVGKSVAGKIFVATWGSDTAGDGSRLKPFASLEKAVSSSVSGNEIILFNGTYTTSSYITLYKNIAITGDGEVIIQTTSRSYNPYVFSLSGGYTLSLNNLVFANVNGGTSSYGTIVEGPSSSYDGNGKLNVVNCTFENNTGVFGPIHGSYMDVNIMGSKFINNTATATGQAGVVVYVQRGSLNIAYSAFVNNNRGYKYDVFTYISTAIAVNVNNNFWGTNEAPILDPNYSDSIPAYWVIVEAEIDSRTITATETHNITLTFKATDGENVTDLAGILPDVEVSLTSELNAVEPTAVISNNVATVEYDAVRDGDEVIVVGLDENELDTLIFVVEEFDDGSKIFVDSENGNDSNNGSKEAPLKTLKAALDAVTEVRQVISIAEGFDYEIANYNINKDVSIIGKKAVMIKANNLTVGATVSFENLAFVYGNKITVSKDGALTVIDSLFGANDGVIESDGDLVIYNSEFYDNNAIDGKGVINALNGNISISNSAFVDCNDGSVVVYSEVEGDVNDNFWGANGEPNVSEIIKPETWVEVNATIDNQVFQGVDATVSIQFVSNDGKELGFTMPSVSLDLYSVIGTVVQSVQIVDNNAVATYNSDVEGNETITICAGEINVTSLEFEVVEDETGKIFVDGTLGDDTDGNGSKANPYKSITKALARNKELGGNQEIIVMAGTYTTSGYYTISANAKITGRGKVVLTKSGTGYLFYNNGNSATAVYDLTLTNLVIENVTSTSSGIIYYKGYYGYSYATYSYQTVYSNLNVYNCTFNNNKAPYGVIYGYQYALLNATGNIFYNNTATSNELIRVSGNQFTFNYNVLIDNKCTYYSGAVYGPTGFDADYNFWGSNNKPTANKDYNSNLNLHNWVVAELAINNDNLAVGDAATVTVNFKYTADGETYVDLDTAMPALTFTLSTALGEIDDNVVVEDNFAFAGYDATAQGDEVITLLYGDKEIANLTFYVDESPIGKIFVDAENGNDTNDGSRTAPFATIAKAIEDNAAKGGNWTIIVKKGQYNLSDAIISDDVTIKCDDYVLIDANGASAFIIKDGANVTIINADIIGAVNAIVAEANTTLTVIDAMFTVNDGVIVSDGATTIYRTSFFENDGTVIKANAGSLDVSYSLFDLNTGTLIDSVIQSTANNNFWGTNRQTNLENVTIDNWVVVTATLEGAPDIFYGIFYNITVKFTSNDGSELNDTLPREHLEGYATLGFVDDVIIIEQNNGVAQYIADKEGSGVINIFLNESDVLQSIPVNVIEDQTGKIYVSTNGSDDTGNGSKENPYATLDEALTHVNSINNQIIIYAGTYVTNSYYRISNSVSITARDGEVILSKTGTGYLFYQNAQTSLGLFGITIENCTSTSYAGVIYVYGTGYSAPSIWTILTIDDCTFRNNQGPSATIWVQNGAKVNITNSNFIDNVATGTTSSGCGLLGSDNYIVLNMHYNNIINTTYAGNYLIYGYSSGSYASGNLDYNFWGDNNAPAGVQTKYTLDYWVGIVVPEIDEIVTVLGEYTIKPEFQYKSYSSDWSDLEYAMPDLAVDVSTLIGAFSNDVVLVNNVGETNYTSYVAGNETILFTVAGKEVGKLEFEVSLIEPQFEFEITNATVGEDTQIKLIPSSDIITEDIVVVVDTVKYTATSANNYTITVNNMAAGEHSIVAIYNGNSFINPAVATESFTVDKINTTIALDVTAATVNDDVIIKAAIDAEGNVTFTIGSDVYSREIVEGVATLVLSDVAGGNYKVAANYAGSENYAPSSANATYDVEKLDASVSIDDIVGAKTTEEVTITVNVPSDATGSVTIKVNGNETDVPIVDGKAVLTVDSLPEGINNITATYNGDARYNTKTEEKSFNVAKAIETELAIDVNATDAEHPTVITVTITDGATGIITLYVDGDEFPQEITDNAAVFTLNLDVGEYVVYAEYDGDGIYEPSVSDDAYFEVVKAEINTNETEVEYGGGDNATISITLPEDATGYVLVDVNGQKFYTELVNGVADIDLSELSEGEHNVTITYLGDDNYDGFTTTKAINVPKELEPVVDNETISIKLPENATGSVTVTIDGVDYPATIVNGTATADISNLNPGSHSVTIKYSGDNTTAPITHTTSVNVPKLAPAISVNVTTIYKGDKENVIITFPSDATGYVLVNVGSLGYYADIVNGTAELSISNLACGNKNVTVKYPGDGRYLESVASANFDVLSKVRLDKNKNIAKDYLQTIKYQVRALDKYGKAVGAGQIVKITVNGKTYNRKTNSKGYASINLKLLPKKYKVVAKYAGKKVTNTLTVKQVLKASKTFSVKKSAKQLVLKATLKSSKGKAIKNKVVKFNLNGKTYSAKTNSKGIAQVTIKQKDINRLKSSKYFVKISYYKTTIKSTLKVVK